MNNETYLLSRMDKTDVHTLMGYQAQGGYGAFKKILEEGTEPKETKEA